MEDDGIDTKLDDIGGGLGKAGEGEYTKYRRKRNHRDWRGFIFQLEEKSVIEVNIVQFLQQLAKWSRSKSCEVCMDEQVEESCGSTSEAEVCLGDMIYIIKFDQSPRPDKTKDRNLKYKA